MRKTKKPDRFTKAIDDTFKLPEKEGNGVLKYTASIDKNSKIARYSFAYINFNLCSSDNGRVLGYDNCHGYHHRHYMGKEEQEIKFKNYESIAVQFEQEWRELHEKIKKRKK